ncbi:MAG: TetR/AcrR family transcriptional regulator [Acidimicrobiales bacterium]
MDSFSDEPLSPVINADEGRKDPGVDNRPTLREDTKSRTRSRIIEGAVRAVAESGLDVTVDEVAIAAGVSRRTVFRHFATHDDLLVAAITEAVRIVDTSMPQPPGPDEDIREWLHESAISVHTLIRRVVGRAFWDLYSARPGISTEVAARAKDASMLRFSFGERMANNAWESIGGERVPPRWLVDTFILNMSGFATNAFLNYTAEQTGRLSAGVLWLVLNDALDQQRSGIIP